MHPVQTAFKQFRTDVLESSDADVAATHAVVISALAVQGDVLDKVAPPPSNITMTPDQFETAKAWRNTVIAHTVRTGLQPIRVAANNDAMLAAASKRRDTIDVLYETFVDSVMDAVGKCHHTTLEGNFVTGDGFLTIYDDGMIKRDIYRIQQVKRPDGLPQWTVRIAITPVV